MDADPGPVTPGGRAGGALHKPGCFIVGQCPGRKSGPGGRLWLDPVNPERTPISAVNVPAKQVPAATPHNEPLRLGGPHALPAIVGDVVEAQSFAGPDCACNCAQHCKINGRSSSGNT